MKDFVSIAFGTLATALDSGSAYTITTVAGAQAENMMRLRNLLDVDMVIMIDSAKPILLSAGDILILDLKAALASITAATGSVAIKCFANAGVAPVSGSLILDCQF